MVVTRVRLDHASALMREGIKIEAVAMLSLASR